MATARDVFVVMIVIFIVAVMTFVVHYGMTQATNQMLTIPIISENSNATAALTGYSSNVLSAGDYGVFVTFIALVLGFIITSWFIGGNPIFIALYVITLIAILVASPILANIWESMTSSGVLVASLGSFPITNHIMLNLPVYTIIIASIGLIVLFAKPFVTGIGDSPQ